MSGFRNSVLMATATGLFLGVSGAAFAGDKVVLFPIYVTMETGGVVVDDVRFRDMTMVMKTTTATTTSAVANGSSDGSQAVHRATAANVSTGELQTLRSQLLAEMRVRGLE